MRQYYNLTARFRSLAARRAPSRSASDLRCEEMPSLRLMFLRWVSTVRTEISSVRRLLCWIALGQLQQDRLFAPCQGLAVAPFRLKRPWRAVHRYRSPRIHRIDGQFDFIGWNVFEEIPHRTVVKGRGDIFGTVMHRQDHNPRSGRCSSKISVAVSPPIRACSDPSGSHRGSVFPACQTRAPLEGAHDLNVVDSFPESTGCLRRPSGGHQRSMRRVCHAWVLRVVLGVWFEGATEWVRGTVASDGAFALRPTEVASAVQLLHPFLHVAQTDAAGLRVCCGLNRCRCR